MNENTTNIEQPNNSTPEENGGQGGKTFTQDEVNRIVSDRLAREREKMNQQGQKDERETALEAREKALEARENKNRCMDYLEEINIGERFRADLLDVLDTTDFDGFKRIVDRLGKWFVVKTTVAGANTEHPPAQTHSTNDALIAQAFKPKI